MNNVARRDFLKGSVCVAAATAVAVTTTAKSKDNKKTSLNKKPTSKLIISAPILMNAAATSIGVTFAVSADASGWVEYSTSADMSNAQRAYSGSLGLMTVDDKLAHIRITGLKKATKYWYRIGADRIVYNHGYDMKNLGPEVDPKIRSFSTIGEDAVASFCVINDTHDHKEVLDMVLTKVAEINPSVLIWNGDATNVTETKEHAIDMFLYTHEKHPEYAAQTPLFFVNGNHDLRGRFARNMNELLMFRDPAERSSEFHDLGRNFVQRIGDIALIGLDTGEDKLDTNPLFAGIYHMKAYREKQARWLAEAIETPEVKTAKFKIAFCHIPLFDSRPKANPGDLAPNDTSPNYSKNWAAWQRTCSKLWGPLFEKAGVQLVISAHQHRFHCDPGTPERSWWQIVGGGCSTDKTLASYPTVIEGKVKNGTLEIVVHNALTNAIAGTFSFN